MSRRSAPRSVGDEAALRDAEATAAVATNATPIRLSERYRGTNKLLPETRENANITSGVVSHHNKPRRNPRNLCGSQPLNRAINVDSRFIIFFLDKYSNAQNLINEMVIR